jgi:hypothetical protein
VPADGAAEGEGEGEGEGEAPCFFGDPAQEPAGELVIRTLDGRTAPFVEGQALPLLKPPQGGKVVMIGARVRHMDCALSITAGAFDDCKGVFLGVDGRPLSLVWNEQTGWAEPDAPETLNNFGNVALCFNNNSARDTNDEEYRFEVRVTELAGRGRTLVLSGRGTPFCAEDAFRDECDCECDVDFSFDRACSDVVVDPDVPAGTCLEVPAGGEGEGEGDAG